ncbi:MAG: TonB-dependent receptor [Polyangiaceae bacterium]
MGEASRVTGVVVASVAFACSAVARAEGPSSTPKARNDDVENVVVTGTRTPESSQRSTIRTDVVTRDEAERRGATNVAEALSRQPGVQVNPGAYGYLGGVSAIQIQGFDRDRVLVLEDGERMVGDVGGAIDLSTLPLSDVSRIEIVTGPTSSLYGSSAIGGVVNVITGPPIHDGPSARARVEGRSRNGLVLQGGGAYRGERAWAALDGNFTRQDRILESALTPDTQVPESTRRMVGLRAGVKLGPRVDVRVRARTFADSLDGVDSQVLPGLGRYVIDLPNETKRHTLHLIEVLDLGGGSNLRMTLGRQWVDNASGTLRRGSPIGETRDRSQRMQSAEFVGTFADGKRTWVLGARFEGEDLTQRITKVESTSEGPRADTTDEVAPLRLASAAAYAQLAYKPFPELTILPGVRAEGHARYPGAVAPRLAVAWRAAKTWILRASGGRGYRTPSAKEFGFAFDHSLYGYRVSGNSSLRPESSWGVNADVTVEPAKAVRLRASGYVNFIEDMIDIDLANGTTTGGVATYAYANFGRAKTLGADVDATFTLAPGFRSQVSYAYLYTRDELNDRPLGGRPPHTVTCSLTGRLPLAVDLTLRYRLVSDAFVSETERSPGYGTFDARLEREVWKKSVAYVGALNVGDVRQEPGRVGDLRPPVGRTFYVGLRAELPWQDE